MPGKIVTHENVDSFHEVLIFVITGIIVFLVITGLMIFVLLFYHKRRLMHQEQLLAKEKEFQQQLLQTQLEIQEQTFNTISSEIHDNVGQILSLAKVQLNIIDQSETLDRTLLSDAKDSVSKAMTDLRDIAKSLNSERIKLYTLHEITEQELQRISRAGFITTTIKTEGEIRSVQEQKKLIIFRIMQEAFNNIIKHAKAKNIDVCFCYQNNFLKIVIADNGAGFDEALIKQKDGLGLRNIISRATLIGGDASIESKPQEGTTITITSPYE